MSGDSLAPISPCSDPEYEEESFRRQTYLWLLAGVFLSILGARLWLIHHFALPVIFHDDWPVEGELFRRYVEGHLSFGYLISSYKGHRLLIPRLFLLGLFIANGRQWDPLVFMAAQAPFYALGITSLVAICGMRMKNWGRAALALFATAAGVIPFGWENAVFACNLDFPTFTLIGLLVIWFCWRHEALSWRWWVGAFLAVTNLFVMGGGIFSTIAITMFTLFGFVLEPARRNTRNIVSALVLVALVVFGIAIAGTHDTHVASVAQFLRSIATVLAWPEDARAILSVVVQAPLVLLTALLLIKRTPASDARWLPVIISASFWIQAAATVHQRTGHLHASRYRDSWLLLIIAIAACLCFLIEASGVWRRYIYLLAIVWSVTILNGAIDCVFHDLPDAIADDQCERLTADDCIRNYLRTGNEASLEHIIDKQEVSPSLVQKMLPPELLNGNPPLVQAQAQQSNSTGTDVTVSSEPDVASSAYGEYNVDHASSPAGIRLSYNVPNGTREVNMLVAGHVDLHVGSYQIRLLVPASLWRSITIPLDPHANRIDIRATGSAMRRMKFSAPTISSHRTLGRWTRDVVGDCAQNSVTRIFWLGLVLMAGALIGMIRTSARPVSGRSLARTLVALSLSGRDAWGGRWWRIAAHRDKMNT